MEPINHSNQIDPFKILPVEIKFQILTYLTNNYPECALVCKLWKELVDDPYLYQQTFPALAFSEKKWQPIGKVEPGPRLPRRIHRDLASGNYHLTLIPNKVNDLPYSLNNEQLFQNQTLPFPTRHRFLAPAIKEELGNNCVQKSYWSLLQKNVINESRNKCAEELEQLIKITHKIPDLLSVSTAILARYSTTGEVFLAKGTYTHVKEIIERDGRKGHIHVGGFVDNNAIERKRGIDIDLRSPTMAETSVGILGAFPLPVKTTTQ